MALAIRDDFWQNVCAPVTTSAKRYKHPRQYAPVVSASLNPGLHASASVLPTKPVRQESLRAVSRICPDWSPKFRANPHPANPHGCWVRCEGRPPHKRRIETEIEGRGPETGSNSGGSEFAFPQKPRQPWPPAGFAKRQSTFCP